MLDLSAAVTVLFLAAGGRWCVAWEATGVSVLWPHCRMDTSVDCRCRLPRCEETQDDDVHGRLKTTDMTTAPQFQLQRTSRGWVRIKK